MSSFEEDLKKRVPEKLKRYIVGNLIPAYKDLEDEALAHDGEISEHSIEWKYQKKNKNSVAKNDTLILEVYHDADTKWGGWCQQATSDCICFVRKDTLNDGLVDIYVLNYPMLVEWWCSKEIKEKYWGMAIKNDITTVNGIPHHRSSFLPMKVDAIPKEIIIADKRRFDTSVLFKSPRNKLTGWC